MSVKSDRKIRKPITAILFAAMMIVSVVAVTGIVSSVLAAVGTWQTKASLRVEGAAGSIIGNKLYVSHGYRPGNSAVLSIYDIPSNTWSTGASAWVSRSELVAVAAGNRHFAFGGRGGMNVVEIYDPTINSWSKGPTMPTGRAGLGAAAIGSKIFVVGGRTGSVPHSGTPLNAVEVLDINTMTWSSVAPMLVPMMDVYATVAFQGKVYVFGGYDGRSVRNTVQIYDPVTDSWSLGANNMPTARSNAAAGVCGGKIYVIGGVTGSLQNLKVNEVYDPITDTWNAAPPKPTAGSEFAVGDISTGSKIFLVGSGIWGATRNIHEAFVCNQPPIANAGPDQIVEQEFYQGADVLLDGSGSYDTEMIP